MRKKLKYIVSGSLILLVVIILIMVNTSANNLSCSNIIINIDTTDGIHFITEEDIKEILINKEKFRIGMKLSELDLNDFENTIKKHPHVKNAEVYIGTSGNLFVEVKQRKPLLRVKNFWGENFYIDSEGQMMPLSEKFVYRVPIVSGLITEHYNPTYKININLNDSSIEENTLSQCFKIATFISKDNFWKFLIDQIFVNYKKEIELILTIGNATILIGQANELNEKFDKLLKFYLYGMKYYSWDKYSKIDLRFKNQIVCKKNK